MINFLKLFFAILLIHILYHTIVAVYDRSVLTAFVELMRDPWGKATLVDAYTAFLTFYVWVFYKEKSWLLKLFWFLFIIGFGTIAITSYMLIQLFKLKKNETIKDLLIQ